MKARRRLLVAAAVVVAVAAVAGCAPHAQNGDTVSLPAVVPAPVSLEASGVPPFRAARDLIRTVQGDCSVEVDANAYSVPWRLVGERVRVTVTAGMVRVFHGGREVAAHRACDGRRQRIVEPSHFQGLAGARRPIFADGAGRRPQNPALLRPLAEYEAQIARDPADREASLGRARVLSWMDRQGPALAEYEAVLRDHPDDLEAQRGAGRVQSWRGRHRDATGRMQGLLASHPHDRQPTAILLRLVETTDARWRRPRRLPAA